MAAPCRWTLRLCTQPFGVNVKVTARNFGISCLHTRNECVTKRQNVRKLLRAINDRGYCKFMSENAFAKFILPVTKCKIGGFTGPCTSKLEHFIPGSSNIVRVYSAQKKDKQKLEDVEPVCFISSRNLSRTTPMEINMIYCLLCTTIVPYTFSSVSTCLCFFLLYTRSCQIMASTKYISTVY